MENEIICDSHDESISTKKKKKRQKQSKDNIVDKLNNNDADCEPEHVTETVLLSNASEKNKRKKHIRKHNCEDSDENCKVETGGKRKLKEKYPYVDDIHKKRKTDDREQTNQLSCDAGVDNKKIKLKRKKEISILTDMPLDSCKNVEPLKKKKKSKGGESGASEIVHDNLSASLEEAEALFGDSKKKKRKQQQNANMHVGGDKEMKDNTKHNNVSNICVDESTSHRKKKKHSKHRDTLSIEEPQLKVHKNNSTFPLDSDNTQEKMECFSEHKSKKSKKAKLEKYLSTGGETQDVKNIADLQSVSGDCMEENANKRKKKKKHSSGKDVSSIDESEHTLHGKKQNSDATCDRGNSQGNVNGGVPQVHLNTQKCVPSSVVMKDNVNNVSSEQNNSNASEEKTQHHNKHSKSKDSSVKNETNQLNINKSSSIDQKAATDSGSSGPVQGQWQGNLFESSERQSKFLRLLGGMKKSSDSSGCTGVAKKEVNGPAGSIKKKGLFGSLTSMVSPSGGNSAMTATAAANLNQKLEDEYNKAMNFKLSGKVGTGFGFMPDPAEGKKFHIDVHKSKSIKFDD